MENELLDELRRHGVHVTAQRLAVLATVRRLPHATAEAIATAVRAQLGAISRQGVYDALASLVEAGLIRRIQPAGSPARFEGRAGDNHHHLICRRCGHVEDIDCAVGAAPCLTPSQDWGYHIDEAEVIYWGVCQTCQAAGRSGPSPTTQPTESSGGAMTEDFSSSTSTPNA